MPNLSAEALHLLTVQDNVIATWQVAHPTREQMRRAHNRGHWRQLTRTAYLAAPSDPTSEQLQWAAALHPGPASLLSGQAALVCHGWSGEPSGPIDVLVPVCRNPRGVPRWLRIHRTRVMPRAVRRGVPRAAAAAAVVDAAAWARSDREAMFIVVSALQQRVTSVQHVERVLQQRPTSPRRAIILETTAEFAGGATSMGELDFGRLCQRFGIRKPDRQVVRWANGRRFLDVHFDEERVTVEIEGVHHLDPEVWVQDTTRQNELVINGDRIFLRAATWMVKYEPDVLMDQLARALGLRI